jgi:hypothetical protein
MKIEVSTAIEDLKHQFPGAAFTVREDGQGGARVLMEPVAIGPKYRPSDTWLGFQIPAQYPYADIYPVFLGNVARLDGKPFVAPLTAGHNFEGRPALQVSRKNSAAQSGFQTAAAKILKVLDFLENLA